MGVADPQALRKPDIVRTYVVPLSSSLSTLQYLGSVHIEFRDDS